MEDIKTKLKMTGTILMICSLVVGCVFLWQAVNFTIFLVSSEGLAENSGLGVLSATYPWALCVVFFYLAYIFFLIGKNRSPFTKRVATHLKVLAILTIVGLPLPLIINDVLFAVSTNSLSLLVLLNTGRLDMLIVGLTFFGFAMIFEYGAMLQTDTDEIV